jgi:hypothetical protein
MDKLFKDKNGKVVITQMPNWQLTLALSFWGLSKVFNQGATEDVFYILFMIFLLLWALAEIFKGVNIFRRVLGLASILYILYRAVGIA